MDNLDELLKLKKLLDDGIISEFEFEGLKKKILTANTNLKQPKTDSNNTIQVSSSFKNNKVEVVSKKSVVPKVILFIIISAIVITFFSIRYFAGTKNSNPHINDSNISKTIKISTPGSLEDLISIEERNTITSITVKGVIDGRDLMFLASLGSSRIRKIDLSEVKIVSTMLDDVLSDTHKYCAEDEIPYNTFTGGEFEQIILPRNLKVIGACAFLGCLKLKSIFIPAKVEEIQDAAFVSCQNLVEINVDKNNSKYLSIEGVLFEKDLKTLICCPSAKLGEFSIPNSVENVVHDAFYGSQLRKIDIPKSVINIGANAFDKCNNIIGHELDSLKTQ